MVTGIPKKCKRCNFPLLWDIEGHIVHKYNEIANHFDKKRFWIQHVQFLLVPLSSSDYQQQNV